MEAETLAAAQHMDFSLLAQFLRASLTVKIVMLSLIAASLWSWAIIIAKFIAYRRASKETAMFEDAFWSGQPLDQLYERVSANPRSASEKVFAAGMSEWRKSHRSDGGMLAGTNARIERAMNVALDKSADQLNAGLTFLATVGSISPFVGLFGTVWGIKGSFEEIAAQQSTNLAVVAPGIAEALLATAMGLLAAIPAVIFYNKLSADADKISGEWEAFMDEFSLILSRQIDGPDN
ncbi:MAG: protein TolQ [Rhodobacteraceae bacterium]|nr:MAG: protein TolQ [Paracoccaceae bacterium]